MSFTELEQTIAEDCYHHQGKLLNNFVQTMTTGIQAFKAVSTFKDEYLLDFINVEEIDVRDAADDLEDLLNVMDSDELTEFQYIVNGDDWTASIK